MSSNDFSKFESNAGYINDNFDTYFSYYVPDEDFSKYIAHHNTINPLLDGCVHLAKMDMLQENNICKLFEQLDLYGRWTDMFSVFICYADIISKFFSNSYRLRNLFIFSDEYGFDWSSLNIKDKYNLLHLCTCYKSEFGNMMIRKAFGDRDIDELLEERRKYLSDH